MQNLEHADILERLAQTAERLSYNANWNPSHEGDSEMRIARNGRWYHQGGEIKRVGLIKLFSRLLRREGDRYFLVTPVEKLSIEVEDAPFVSINIEFQGEGDEQVVYVTTNLDDTLCIGDQHPLVVTIDPQTQEPSPYVSIGASLSVLLQRSDFYQLVERAEKREIDGRKVLGVLSQGRFYILGDY
ncbi:DUF1285 domain-containing protein [Denitrificimonas sp. JX-1]|uniref:DUF1285 domain-containing protein n=1 Tax=Denitrificimonas halotolerans TaxID=3098930 RepID=A0ABU5GQ22_9GAMM|nr:DUF1285 domain-containing protein [Denitrificimonas sp. JX-1]MDY7219093.1 DUF1285 domain-containing protein [Denitrificimonas sp. JX-1]